MTTEARDLLEALQRRGLRIGVRNGALVLAPRSRLTDELLEAARRLKPAILALLGGNGVERSRSPWALQVAATFAATSPPGGWPLAWRDALRVARPALLRRVERAEAQCEAVVARLEAGEDATAAWSAAHREFEVALFDARAELRALQARRSREEA